MHTVGPYLMLMATPTPRNLNQIIKTVSKSMEQEKCDNAEVPECCLHVVKGGTHTAPV
jgi:hypothetical protein